MEKKRGENIHPVSGVYFLIFTAGRTHVGPVSRGSITLKQGILPQERESGGVDFNRVGFVKSS